ncbi:DNA-binding transcriptional regulator, LysR family [Colwellia chukchiensis]|uniref:DNA-binding transcriptional regulator, LysR family n=1 Tax=Colwellia chukchiensis TaxID=641665 RepID=A0A1H7N827_9GAMM|nr:LysR family transcriptional regulator [Colwellia chukchiensis]SEL19441.1 DNA-binding transcriptional regulator, LysR family [Colwellia chukchiensis]
MESYRRLPSLKALQTLQAVVTHKSISQAAKSLNLTHSAVSQSIKQLEEVLGYKVLLKDGRNIAPTKNADEYVREINDALTHLSLATQRFKQREGSNIVTLKMVTSLAMRWFIPQLNELKMAFPALDIRLVSEHFSDIDDLPFDVDAGVGYGLEKDFMQLHSHKVSSSELLLLSQRPYCNIAQALQENTAIYVASELRKNDWQAWCQALGIEQPSHDKRLVLPNSAQALEAVTSGVGVLVSQSIFVKPMLKTKLLYQIGGSVVNDNQGYYFYYRPEQINHSALTALAHWLAAR